MSETKISLWSSCTVGGQVHPVLPSLSLKACRALWCGYVQLCDFVRSMFPKTCTVISVMNDCCWNCPIITTGEGMEEKWGWPTSNRAKVRHQGWVFLPPKIKVFPVEVGRGVCGWRRRLFSPWLCFVSNLSVLQRVHGWVRGNASHREPAGVKSSARLAVVCESWWRALLSHK